MEYGEKISWRITEVVNLAGFGSSLDVENEESQVSGLGNSGATNRFRVKRRSEFGVGKNSILYMQVLRL